MYNFTPKRRGAKLIEFLASSPAHFGLGRGYAPGGSEMLLHPIAPNSAHQNFSIGGNFNFGPRASTSAPDDKDRNQKRKTKGRSTHERGETLAGLGEWFVYVKTVRENDKLSNAEKAQKARDWALNFEVKGYTYYQTEAENDAEEYQRAADEEARQREEQRSRETEKRQRRYERSCPSCHRGKPEERPVSPPWRYPEEQNSDGSSDDTQD